MTGDVSWGWLEVAWEFRSGFVYGQDLRGVGRHMLYFIMHLAVQNIADIKQTLDLFIIST